MCRKNLGADSNAGIFAGAYGGWASAVRVLKQQGNHTQIVAVDNDLDACKTYALVMGLH